MKESARIKKLVHLRNKGITQRGQHNAKMRDAGKWGRDKRLLWGDRFRFYPY